MSTFNHQEIEAKYSTLWAKNKLYKTPKIKLGDKKKYILDMFPYPSGAGLHVGHPRGYVATDILSRFYRANGYKVLHPMGWDAFGLPAEQYAVKTGEHPNISTQRNIQTFKKQLNSLGLSYDWEREIDTTDKNYYKWTQWIFLQLFDKGLAYESEMAVNWCSELGTILANEEVISGKSERGNYAVTKMPVKQWLLKITDYAERLNKDLELLPNWPNKIRLMQTNWIGQSEGNLINFEIKSQNNLQIKEIEIFSTAIETVFGATFLVISPEHKLVKESIPFAKNRTQIEEYLNKTATKSDMERTDLNKEKSGIVLDGVWAINPINNKEIPIWIADYVLTNYGTGAIMSVPGNDERDFEFATKFGLEIIFTTQNEFVSYSQIKKNPKNFVINTDQYEDLNFEQAKIEILEKLNSIHKSKPKTNFKLRDWVFSRQRYWGEPIPIVFEVDDFGKKVSGPIALDDSELPLSLPKVDDFRQIAIDKSGKPEPILARFPDWVNVFGYYLPNGKVKIIDQKDIQNTQNTANYHNQNSNQNSKVSENENQGLKNNQNLLNKDLEFVKIENQENNQMKKIELKKFVRETNTMPQWAGSSWYYLRFMDNLNENSFCGAEKLWGQVDIYVGGAEHAVLHLLYARFWHKVLFDLDLVSHLEPFDKLINQGLILATDGQKMSKSLGNVVNPDDIIRDFGADTLRIFEMFLGPFEQSVAWNDTAIIGVKRFLDKVWNLQERIYLQNDKLLNRGLQSNTKIMFEPKTQKAVEIELNKLITKITSDIENIKFNTCISEFMKFINFVEKTGAITFAQISKFVVLLAPFAPFLCEEIYANLVNIFEKANYQGISFENSDKNEKFVFEPKNSVHEESWPTVSQVNLEKESTILSVQINGKVRGIVEINNQNSEEIKKMVLELEFVKKYLEDKNLQKFIYIPQKAISLVISK